MVKNGSHEWGVNFFLLTICTCELSQKIWFTSGWGRGNNRLEVLESFKNFPWFFLSPFANQYYSWASFATFTVDGYYSSYQWKNQCCDTAEESENNSRCSRVVWDAFKAFPVGIVMENKGLQKKSNKGRKKAIKDSQLQGPVLQAVWNINTIRGSSCEGKIELISELMSY